MSLELIKTRSRECNDRGDRSLTAFFSSPRLQNNENQPITCTLYPRRKGSAEYIAEVSSQVGCVIGCASCGCGKFRGNLTPDDVVDQIRTLIEAAQARFPSVSVNKINFTDGGELLLNPHCAEILQAATNHCHAFVKISTVLPDTPLTKQNIEHVIDFMRSYGPGITLQVSMHSTSPNERLSYVGVRLFSFQDLRELGERWQSLHPAQRKITLTFTLVSTTRCRPEEIVDLLPPDLFRIRLHPCKPNSNGQNTHTMSRERCIALEQEFIGLGYTVQRDEYDEI
ncbi:hypothetical protein HZC21_01495 [Candidatus Peregrinibacteria bacterium]|nr:hypothetical protein [Candidatus Peregrinibacteria bacterium]